MNFRKKFVVKLGAKFSPDCKRSFAESLSHARDGGLLRRLLK